MNGSYFLIYNPLQLLFTFIRDREILKKILPQEVDTIIIAVCISPVEKEALHEHKQDGQAQNTFLQH